VFQTEQFKSQGKAIELIKFVEAAEEDAYDLWVSPRVGTYAKIMSAPKHIAALEKFFKDHSISFSVLIEDVQESIRRESVDRYARRKAKTSSRSIDFENYYGVDDLKADYDFVDVEVYGQSYEKRDLKVIKIQKAGSGAPNIFIEAGIHAREWIAPAMATYIIHSLLEFNFHIMPSVNPDGYEYSREEVLLFNALIILRRLWRKTRRDNQGSSCKGVDANRNWAFHWHGDNNMTAIEDPETESIRQYVESLNPTPLMSLSLHSAANLWLFGLAEKAVDALNEVHHAGFQAINSADLYPAAGASDDWYLGVLGSTYGYTVELRQGGYYGFDLPPEQINESGEELWAGMQVIFDRLHEVSA
ncbi:Carboxypeptidase B, partial [Caligus rogercresseyi]